MSKHRLPDDIKYAYHEGVELYLKIRDYENDVLSENELINELRSVKSKWDQITLEKFLFYLNDKCLINNHDFDYEKTIDEYLKSRL